MSSPLSIALASHPAMGHVNSLRSIGLALRERGHGLRFFVPLPPRLPSFVPRLTGALGAAFDIGPMLERDGFATTGLSVRLSFVLQARALVRARGQEELLRAVSLLSDGIVPAARKMVRVLRRHPVDAMVVDFAFFAGAFAAELTDTPWVSVYHAGLPFPGLGVPPYGSGLPLFESDHPGLEEARARGQVIAARLEDRLARARQALGLPPKRLNPLQVPASPWLNLLTTHPAIEAPRRLSPEAVCVGPCLETRRGSDCSDFPWSWLEAGETKVYVSLGTVFNNRPEVFRELLDGLDDPRLRVVVSAGAACDALMRTGVPEHVRIFRQVPQLELLEKVDIVLGHGGNNTTNETLAAGRPLLVVPIGGEQHDNAQRVTWLGAGLWMPLSELTAERVRAAVTRLRTEPRFAQRAAELATLLTSCDGAKAGAGLVERLGRERRPLRFEGEMPVVLAPATSAGESGEGESGRRAS